MKYLNVSYLDIFSFQQTHDYDGEKGKNVPWGFLLRAQKTMIKTLKSHHELLGEGFSMFNL